MTKATLPKWFVKIRRKFLKRAKRYYYCISTEEEYD